MTKMATAARNILVSSAQALFLAILISDFVTIASARAFVAQVTAAGSTLSPYYVVSSLSIGTPPQAQNLLISTDTPSHSWVTCGPGASFRPARSSTFRQLRCGRKPCFEVVKPYATAAGRLVQDTFSLHSTNGSSQGAFAAVPHVTFACVNPRSVSRAGITGVASLTAGNRGLPAQLGVSKFAYCLPQSLGSNRLPTPLFFGSGFSYLFTNVPVAMNISAFLSHAKLRINERTGQLSVGLKNVSIDLQATLSLRSPLELQISSTVPFTKLARGVYVRMRDVFREKAAARGIQRVAGQAGFDTCFNASTIGFSRVGPAVPSIVLGLEGEALLSVFGFNSLVSVSSTVSCWAFLDAGVGKPSVLGTFQQQGGLFEFDLRNRLLGFSGVLDFFRTSCTNFIF